LPDQVPRVSAARPAYTAAAPSSSSMREEPLAFPHTHLCIEAALSGLGVALVERRLIARELQDGLLVAPYGFVPFEGGLRAVPAASRAQAAQAGVFLDWLRGALA
jgi:DNA-binding transcriptional LysR family regulator